MSQSKLYSSPFLQSATCNAFQSVPVSLTTTNSAVTSANTTNLSANTTNLNDLLSLMLSKNSLLDSQLDTQIKQQSNQNLITQQQNLINLQQQYQASSQLPPASTTVTNIIPIPPLNPTLNFNCFTPINVDTSNINLSFETRISLEFAKQQIAATTAATTAAKIQTKILPIASPISKLLLG